MKTWLRYSAGKLRAGVEAHPERGDVRPEVLRRRGELAASVLRAEIRIADRAAVAVRIAEALAAPRDAIELVGRLVVAELVAPVVGEPQFPRARVPVEAHRVAHAARDDLVAAPSAFMRPMFA
jgi:hypothetical protein